MKRLIPVLVAILLFSSLLLAACSTATPAPTTSAAPAQQTTTAAPPPPATTTTVAPATTTTTAPATTTTTAPPAKTYKFTYNNFFPATHDNSILAQMWMAEITQRTNGAVQFNYLPGASLTSPDKVYDGVVSGISDIGFSVVAYTPGRFPVTELLDYPQGYPSGYVSTMVSNAYFNQFKPAEFNDVHVFYFYNTGPQVIFTTKKPVSKLEDLKGMVLRSTGIGASIAKALGATGYAAAQNDAYELMSKGVIDGSVTPREVLLSWKQAEVVNYVTECYDIGSASNMYIVMNKDKWNSLPADIQKVFTDASQEMAQDSAMISSALDKQGLDYFNSLPNRQEITLSLDESARWVAAVQPLVDQKLADLKAKGFPADEYESFIKDQIKAWAAKAPSADECVAWVKANLKAP